jgi:ABC-type uncharacterized transport system auxiliary subunit
MRRTFLQSLSLFLVTAMIGCGTARPAKYYALEFPTDSPAAATPYPVTLLVGRVSAPHLYRDDRIVFANGPVQMGTYEYERWAEPPTDMIENGLVRTLRASGRFRAVEHLSSNTRGDFILHGHLIALQEVDQPGVAARFTIELEMFEPKTGTTVWSQVYTHDEPVGGKTVPAVVEALNREVRAGMEQLSAGIAEYFANHPPK